MGSFTMKFLKVLFSISLLTFSIFIFSCSSDSSTNQTPTNTTKFTCTLNGGGFNNITITYGTAAGAIYVPVDDETGISFTGATQSEVGTVSFQGNKTGTFTITEDNNNNIALLFAGNTGLTLTSGTITVTTYGNIGGDIIGTFSGSGTYSSNDQTVQVTNGSFSAKRLY
jgi:hypothetical protein